MMRCLTNLLDRFLDWLAPPIQITDVLSANDLADIEADLDCLGPDDLWAAHQRFPAAVVDTRGGDGTGTTPSPVRPAGADTSAVGPGGPFKSDEVLIEELVADYREFLRSCFRRG